MNKEKIILTLKEKKMIDQIMKNYLDEGYSWHFNKKGLSIVDTQTQKLVKYYKGI